MRGRWNLQPQLQAKTAESPRQNLHSSSTSPQNHVQTLLAWNLIWLETKITRIPNFSSALISSTKTTMILEGRWRLVKLRSSSSRLTKLKMSSPISAPLLPHRIFRVTPTQCHSRPIKTRFSLAQFSWAPRTASWKMYKMRYLWSHAVANPQRRQQLLKSLRSLRPSTALTDKNRSDSMVAKSQTMDSYMAMSRFRYVSSCG